MELGLRPFPYKGHAAVKEWIQMKLDDIKDWILPSVLDMPGQPKINAPKPLKPAGPTLPHEYLALVLSKKPSAAPVVSS
jgi:hypothetical protein